MSGIDIPLVPTVDDNRLYYSSLKQTFHDQPQKLDEFIDILKDHRDKRIDDAVLFSRVQESLKDHRKLLLGYSALHPDFYRTIPPKLSKALGRFQAIPTMVGKRISHVLTMDDAHEYTACVEEALRDQPEKFREFLKILLTAHHTVSDAVVMARVHEILKDHPKLLRSFIVVLTNEPKVKIPPVTAPTPTPTPTPTPNKNKRKQAPVSNGADVINRPKTRSQTRSQTRGTQDKSIRTR